MWVDASTAANLTEVLETDAMHHTLTKHTDKGPFPKTAAVS